MAAKRYDTIPKSRWKWLGTGFRLLDEDLAGLNDRVDNLPTGGGAGTPLSSWADLPAPSLRRIVRRYVTADSTYYRGEICLYEGRAVLMRNTVTMTKGTSKPWLSTSAYIPLGMLGVWDATAFGVTFWDKAKAADNTAAMADLLKEATKYGGQVIDMGAGMAYFAANAAGTAAIELPTGMTLAGRGYRSTWLLLADGANVPLVKAHTSTGAGDANASLVGVRDLTLDGSKATQTAAKNLLEFVTEPLHTAQNASGETFDMRAFVHRVELRNSKGGGLYAAGRAGHSFVDVWSQHNEGHGFEIAFDTTMTNCQSENNGLSGFRFRSGQAQIAGCKAFNNGWDSAGNKRKTTGDIHGFHASGWAPGVSLAGCNAQNNSGSGLYVEGENASVVASSFLADTNNTGFNNYAAITIDGAHRCIIDAFCTQSDQADAPPIGHQEDALRIVGGASQNHVTVSQQATTGSVLGVNQAGASEDSTVDGNVVVVNGQTLGATEVAGATPGVLPPVGGWLSSPSASASVGAARAAGSLSVLPIPVTAAIRVSAVGCYVHQAQTGGDVTVQVGLWPSRADQSGPDFTRPVHVGSIDAAATGAKNTALGTPAGLAPGLYWAGLLYVAATAPTTAPQFAVSSATSGLWAPTAGAVPRGLAATGLTAMPTDNTVTPTIDYSQPAIVSIRRA